MSARQLTLPVHLPEDMTFANFYAGINSIVITYLQEFILNSREHSVYLWGQPGVGCSHLLQACCQLAHEQKLQAIYLPLAQLSEFGPAFLENLETCAVVCIDDIQMIAGKPAWEEALFHFYNRQQAAQSCLLVAANTVPSKLGVQLPDLLSRLMSAVIFQVQQLNDADKLLALQLRAKLRGLELPDEVGQFLLVRIPRDWPALFAVLEKLDHASLAAQRRLTIPFVKTALGIM